MRNSSPQQPLRSKLASESSLAAGFKMADRPVPVRDLKLLDVKLGQLPGWLATRDYTPTGIFLGLRRGHDRFVKKYIDVKKTSFAGIAIMLTSYVVLSYVWNYQHLKHDRMRKYH
ncbi:ATP synthase subunit f, mitochondrial isoform X2 [Hemicordylus capensis]|uniref:ATP synthase subunit f, mitochondrial isoform X2 n=1 Tax=Hemicordylus capensis TaxID=884348 RepID=UPI0023021191|nr:ATP synthase subunit f, mitochondrial isoform X2 [Hemicordylus capensis]